jgi:hypothetical protein
MDGIQLVGYLFRILVAVVAGALLARAWIRLLRRQTRIEGVIETITPGRTRRSRVGGGPPTLRTASHVATIRFEVLDRSYRFDHDYNPEFDRWSEGDPVPVLYESLNPANASVDGGRLRDNELAILSVLLVAFVWFLIFR